VLRLAHSVPGDLVFFGKVYDVAPDGSATLIHRLVAPVRVPDAAVGETVRIKLLGFAHRFAPGHAVRLTLAATDATSYNRKAPDQITVDLGPGATFTLPGVLAQTARAPQVVPPPKAPAPAPRGTLPATGTDPLLPLVALGLLGAAAVVRRRRTT
jgi:LPXTG-motif cell wall-anchored protein